MKKFLAFLCAVMVLASATITASAEEVNQSTVITTTVPSAYVLTIPASVDIPYGEKNATIGSVKQSLWHYYGGTVGDSGGGSMSTGLHKKTTATAEDYRTPMQVAHLHRYRGTDYYICPRCNTTMEREFMHYCDRCGQCLCWKNYKKVVVIRERESVPR